ADILGLREQAAAILGKAKYKTLISAMAAVFDQWASIWLKYASDAAWFAHFLPTDAGQILLPSGIKHLAKVIGSFRHVACTRHDLGALFAQALAACWSHWRTKVESDSDVRSAFLTIFTDLTARQVPEAVHLRTKVAAVVGTS